MPRWAQVLEPLEHQFRADGTVGPVRFRAVAARPIAIPPVGLPLVPLRAAPPAASPPAKPRRGARDAMPVLGRLRLHLEYVRMADDASGAAVQPGIGEREWFRLESRRVERSRRRARPVGGDRLMVPGSAPDAVGSLVEHFGLRAVSRALARVAASDLPTPDLVANGTPPTAREREGAHAYPGDARRLTARERAARRGFFVA